jgi:hypothetical protein
MAGAPFCAGLGLIAFKFVCQGTVQPQAKSFSSQFRIP